jgi:hypothetical protein
MPFGLSLMKLLAIRLSPQAGQSLVMSKALNPHAFRQAQRERIHTLFVPDQ